MKKHKILLLSDHLLSTSGVGTQGRFLANGLINKGHWTIRQLGGAVKHANYDTVVVNDDLIIKPVNGFGDRELLRNLLVTEKPDVLMLFTDPRFFLWVWELEEEIHQICPIVYWHLWDNAPAPEYNRVLYESTDLINCINYPTYKFCKKRWPEKTNYVPHAVPPELYRPLPPEEVTKARHDLLKGRCDDHFVGLWVNRNARRKQPGDAMLGWKEFLDQLEAKHGHRKATLVMHTDPLDQEGTNLYVLADMLGIKENVFFSNSRFEFEQMAIMYNVADFVMNNSSAEGHGLPTMEAMQCGKPILAIKTGGLTRQVVNPYTGYEHGVALDVDVKSLVGSQMCPYIWDDYVSSHTIANGLMKLYDAGPEKRAEMGRKAREYVLEEYNLQKMVDDWDRTMLDVLDRWKNDRKSVYKPWSTVTI